MEFSTCKLYKWNLNAKHIWIQAKTSSEKQHALFIHIAMLQNKPAFCADYQTHELYNRTSTHNTWTLLKISLTVPEMVYQPRIC